jgi:hypothetical protein
VEQVCTKFLATFAGRPCLQSRGRSVSPTSSQPARAQGEAGRFAQADRRGRKK